MHPLLVNLLAAVLVLATHSASRSRDTNDDSHQRLSRTETVRPGQLLEIDLVTGAGLRITAWDRNEVHMECGWLESECPDAELEFENTSEGVALSTTYRKHSGWNHSCSLEIEIQVPRRFDVRLKSSGGSLEISGVEGTFEGNTGGGAIRLERVRGDVRLRTGGGAITVRDSDLDGRLQTGGGAVRFQDVVGTVAAYSGSRRGVVRASPR
jgi:hypothetical protein